MTFRSDSRSSSLIRYGLLLAIYLAISGLEWVAWGSSGPIHDVLAGVLDFALVNALAGAGLFLGATGIVAFLRGKTEMLTPGPLASIGCLGFGGFMAWAAVAIWL